MTGGNPRGTRPLDGSGNPLFLMACILLAAGPVTVSAEEIIVAEFDGAKITAAELMESLDLFPEQSHAEILDTANRRKFVENFVSQKLLIKEFARRKIDQSPKFAKLMDFAKNDVRLVLLREQLRSEMKTDEKDVKEYFEAHRKDFLVPEKRRARHILVADEKKAKDILQRLKSGGSFEKEARLNSVHKESAAGGGDLGWRTREELQPEFSKVIFSMKTGETLDRPARTRFGWHVIRLDAVTPAAVPPFADVKEAVRQRFVNVRNANALPDLLKRLKENADIKIYDSRLPSIAPPKKPAE